MIFFRCTVGGSGKGNTVTVTCAEEFAGLTITLSKTGKTYTKTCPSTAPYVVTYYGVENGTYTVSCTVDGEAYSETVIVQDISCVLNYGFNWKLWVDTSSQLDSSDYDTLDEILEDEKALRELFLEHACVDYMAESTASNEDLETIINNDLCAKWINLSDYALDFLHANEVIADLMDEADKYGYGEWVKIKTNLVPIMTSNTTPSGTVFASSVFENNPTYAAWKAFDQSTSTGWICAQNYYANSYIGYDFGEATPIKFVSIRNSTLARSPVNYKMQGSNDNQSWTDLTSTFNDFTADAQTKEYQLTEGANYRYYRLLIGSIKTTSEQIVQINELALSNYVWQPKGNVPVMTSNTAPYGTVSASSTYSSSSASNAFDGNDSSYWYTNGGETTKYIQYKSTNPICVKRIKFFVNAAGVTPSTAYFYGSNDGTTYDLLSTISFTSEDINKANNYRDIDNDSYYLYHKIQVNDNIRVGTDQRDLRFNTLQFYGRELKVSVPTMTSNTAPFGTVTANASHNEYPAWQAFDGNNSSLWAASTGTSGSNLWIQYSFINPIMVLKFYQKFQVENINSISYKIQGSNDNSNWVDLTDAITDKSATTRAITKNADYYLHYRLYITSIVHNGNMAMGRLQTLQFYGLDYSEKEFEEGTTKKWLYDHGVELVDIRAYASGSGEAIKSDDGIYLYSQNSQVAVASNNLAIDLTDYSLLKARFDPIYTSISNGTFCELAVLSNQPTSYSDTSALAYMDGTAINKDNISCDITSFNEERYVGTYFSASSNNTKFELKELWLE